MVNLANINDLPEWQKKLDNNTKLSKLSIPGTHNSEAYHTSLPSVQCQNASVTEQLNHGVRFLDIRAGMKPLSSVISTITSTFTGSTNSNTPSSEVKELYVVHGKFPVKLPTSTPLGDVLKEVYEFLGKHSSESVIISIKQEGEGSWDGDDFPKLFWSKYVQPNKDKYFLKNEIPKIGDVRGKVILFRRFGINDGNLKNELGGFDAASWSYNTTSDDRGSFDVQDFCEIQQASDIETKSKYIKDLLKKAGEYTPNNDNKLFINFCSGSNFFDVECWPEKIATGLNKYGVTDAFVKGCGIVVLDYVASDDWKNVRALVGSNF